MKLVIMKKDIQGRDLQHHEEYKIEVPPDEEKNITHLQKILKNYKIRPAIGMAMLILRIN
jgi:hypothetical protein